MLVKPAPEASFRLTGAHLRTDGWKCQVGYWLPVLIGVNRVSLSVQSITQLTGDVTHCMSFITPSHHRLFKWHCRLTFGVEAHTHTSGATYFWLNLSLN